MPKFIKYQLKGRRCLGRPQKDGKILFCNACNRPSKSNNGKVDNENDTIKKIKW
jgi:hypothetical protein